jgi:DNA-binding NarL/FixJ family response regulator
VIRVLIAEDHPLHRLALIEALDRDPEFEVVAAVEDGLAALSGASELEPDVILLDVDVDVAGVTGPEVAEDLLRRDRAARVLFLSSSADPEVMERCFASGALGFIVKHATKAEIKQAIKSVHGRRPVRPGAAPHLNGLRHAPEWSALTERELEVLQHVSHGLAASQIATLMYLTPAAVCAHLNAIYLKLGVNSRAGAAGDALRRRILSC